MVLAPSLRPSRRRLLLAMVSGPLLLTLVAQRNLTHRQPDQSALSVASQVLSIEPSRVVRSPETALNCYWSMQKRGLES